MLKVSYHTKGNTINHFKEVSEDVWENYHCTSKQY